MIWTVVYRRTAFGREPHPVGGALWRVDREGEPQEFTSGRNDGDCSAAIHPNNR
jgi:hypothetical protein